jgi:pyridoxamine 5'-phosphate oxidase
VSILDEVPVDPARLLREWLPGNDDIARPTMTVATVTKDGLPAARTMLLSAWDEDGFYLHTDAHSRKVAELTAHPVAALVFYLPAVARQLVAHGPVAALDADELARAYQQRSPYLQQLAWQNTPEFAALPLAQRRAAWAAFAVAHPAGFTPPAAWTGFLVRPERLTFWQGADDTASRRLEYTRRDGHWEVSILAG